ATSARCQWWSGASMGWLRPASICATCAIAWARWRDARSATSMSTTTCETSPTTTTRTPARPAASSAATGAAESLSALGGADRLLAQSVIGQDEGSHGLDHRHRPREHARVVSAATPDGGVLAAGAHRALLLHDGGGRLERDAEIDRLAVADAALDPAAQV